MQVYAPPRIEDLRELIELVSEYPIDARSLVELAEENDFPEGVIEFYSRFLPDEPFFKAKDLETRTEQVLMLEHQDAPTENMDANEED